MPLNLGAALKRRLVSASGDFFTYISENSGTGALTLALPSAAAGDLCIVSQFMDDASSLTGASNTSVPTIGGNAFTLVFGAYAAAPDIVRNISCRVLTAGDISSGTITSEVTSGVPETAAALACQIWRPSWTISSILPTGMSSVTTVPLTITASGSSTAPVLIVGATSGNAIGGTTSPAYDQVTTAGSTELEMGVRQDITQPVGDQIHDDAGAGANYGGYIEFT